MKTKQNHLHLSKTIITTIIFTEHGIQNTQFNQNQLFSIEPTAIEKTRRCLHKQSC